MEATETTVLIQLLETRTGFTFPGALRDLYLRSGGTTSNAIRLLTLSDMIFMLDNWPRYGFEPSYLPIAEDDKGDLYCVRYCPPDQGHVFHLRWSGEDLDQFGDVEQFIKAIFSPTDK